MDALIRFGDKNGKAFDSGTVRRVYDSTAHGNPLRKFMRDECVYDVSSLTYMSIHVAGAHPEFARDVMVEFLRVKGFNLMEKVKDVYRMHERHGRYTDKCRYHQHNESHPRCVSEPEKERVSPTE